MGGGGLMQLVAYGMQDMYLTGNAQITFFKNLYRRHTNFSVEAVEQNFQSASSQFGNRLVAVISRNGDLLHRVWLEVELPTDLPLDLTGGAGGAGDTSQTISTKKYRYVSKLGNALLKSAEVEIGGQRIDKIYGRWEEVWQGFSKRQDKKACFDRLTANHGDNIYGVGANSAAEDLPLAATANTTPSSSDAQAWDASCFGSGVDGETPRAHYPILPERGGGGDNGTYKRVAGGKFKAYLPLNFWFSKGGAGAALPLIALQYHEVRITIELAKANEILIKHCVNPQSSVASSPPFEGADFYEAPVDVEVSSYGGGAGFQMKSTPKLYGDFYYLDTDERRRFSQMSHEYLVEQLQFTGKESFVVSTVGETTTSLRLNFNHPTKAIYFTAEPSALVSTNLEAGLLPNPFYNGHCHPVRVNNDQRQYMLSQPEGPHDNSPFASVGLMLNGHDRFSSRSGSYFTWIQPMQHHTRCPPGDVRHGSWCGMYSFCLSPEEHQPSGALNFSRIDSAQLRMTFKPADVDFSRGHGADSPFGGDGATASKDDGRHSRDVYVYALSYNVLRILSGMGGLAFSN